MKLLAKPGHRICWFYLAILLSAAGMVGLFGSGFRENLLAGLLCMAFGSVFGRS